MQSNELVKIVMEKNSNEIVKIAMEKKALSTKLFVRAARKSNRLANEWRRLSNSLPVGDFTVKDLKKDKGLTWMAYLGGRNRRRDFLAHAWASKGLHPFTYSRTLDLSSRHKRELNPGILKRIGRTPNGSDYWLDPRWVSY